MGIKPRLDVQPDFRVAETRDMYLLPYVMLNLGGLLAAAGKVAVGARLLGAAQGMFDAGGMAVDPADRPVFDDHVARARATLGADAFIVAFDEGKRMDASAASASALDALAAIEGTQTS